jgi:pilus assembly protein CpaB
VPVEQAGRLLLGAHSGKLYLALRNPGDSAVADESAFASPASVLGLRRDLDPQARVTAMTPENQAFAGIDLMALAGKETRPPASVAAPATTAPRRASNRAPARNANGVEIIRGTAPATPLSSP